MLHRALCRRRFPTVLAFRFALGRDRGSSCPLGGRFAASLTSGFNRLQLPGLTARWPAGLPVGDRRTGCAMTVLEP